MKIIIDTDPGVDDAMAIFYAHAAPDIELVGLTTVFGNVWVEQATRNANYLMEFLGADCPVAQGAAEPYEITGFQPSAHVHGPEGFGDHVEIETERAPIAESAVEFLVRMARENPGEIVVCAVSPLTNIADAMRLDPDFVTNVGRIVIMGGAVDVPGNIRGCAEANIFHDPHAAAEVFASGAKITLVGLDVTMQTLCLREDFMTLAETAPRAGGFLLQISEFYHNFYETVVGKTGCAMHDATAVIAATHMELFTTESSGLTVDLSDAALGKTTRAPSNPPAEICLGIDADAVKARFFDVVASLG
ncbi:nucleoside hydrolase [Ruegeria sp. 2205SS24-7]|uniref:nucleoside hydrolase n=1 Tax=Ruegeria discodermiae TaxID=3064389 RepID=UPI002741FF7F|nr:nucleoside hydrolase [Ruegeria sp. 2205SS24-7]MDP5219177.1 nucleoside hydrolase [Ruegeria sp. 2205SS24-7]